MLFDIMQQHDYEQVVFCYDKGAGLKAIIAIHDTTLGPALGGVRMWNYASEEEALKDVIRLARAMTYKAAAAGLNFGGGKAVIMGDPLKDKSEALFRTFGRFVDSLRGRYITTEDVGTAERDMEWIKTETDFVTGLPISEGGSGDPSTATALGILAGIKACAKEVFGAYSLAGRTVAIQGVGKVGYYLAENLREEKARIIACDIVEAAAMRAKQEFKATIVETEAIYDVACDIFAPCALGGVLNSKTIPRLKCRIVAGGANNQLEGEEDGAALANRGILYGPDYVLNAGGIINLSYEVEGYYNAEAAFERIIKGVSETMEKVIALSKENKISTAKAADLIAEERIKSVRQLKKMHLL